MMLDAKIPEAPIERKKAAYTSMSRTPGSGSGKKTLRFPATWATRYPIKMAPVTATTAFLPSVL